MSHPGPTELRNMEQTLYSWPQFNKSSERLNPLYLTRKYVPNLVILCECAFGDTSFLLKELSARENDISSPFGELGNPELKPFSNKLFSCFYPRQIQLTDGTKGRLSENGDSYAPL